MMRQQNEAKIRVFLAYLAEVHQMPQDDLARYRDSLAILLNWCGDRRLCDAPGFVPALPAYLFAGFPWLSRQAVLETSRYFFCWVKATYPNEFTQMPLSWIETLKGEVLPVPQAMSRTDHNLPVALWRSEILTSDCSICLAQSEAERSKRNLCCITNRKILL